MSTIEIVEWIAIGFKMACAIVLWTIVFFVTRDWIKAIRRHRKEKEQKELQEYDNYFAKMRGTQDDGEEGPGN